MTTMITVPARSAKAFRLAAGQQLRVINTHGTQVVDAWALRADDPDEYLSMEHTRTALARLVPARGDRLYSNRRRALLELAEDTSPGVHDTLIAACDPERYRQLGAPKGHANCADQFRAALAGHAAVPSHVPAPLNLFMNVQWHPDGTLDFRPTVASAGDHVTLRATTEVLVVLSACPMDLNPINNGEPTSVDIELN